MTRRKTGATGPDGYEVIEASNDLRKKVRELPVRSPADDPVARAEAALEKLSTHFEDWMRDEIDKVVEGHDAWVRAGHPAGAAKAAFFRAVHDVKGQAATLGFPLAARAAGSLCALLERMDPARPVPQHLVDSHVEAIRAIFRERAKDESDRVGKALVDALDGVTAGWIEENGLPQAPVEDFEA